MKLFRFALALSVPLAMTAGSSAPVRAQDAPPAAARQVTVERVDVRGNQYLPKDTILYYVSTKVGSVYDEEIIRADFRRLWEAGFLENMSVEESDTPSGNKALLFTVSERKRIQIVDYRGSKALTKTNIEDKLKEKEAALRLDSFYDPSKARRAEDVIREMLKEKGRLFGTVKHEARTIGGSGEQVTFTIDDGPKTKIKAINFENNSVYSDGRLRGEMKKLKQAGFWNLSWLSGKATYNDEKWGEDQELLRDHYLNAGYVTASIGEPKITYVDGKSGLFRKKPVKWMMIDIPITEGEPYRVGKVEFAGMKLFKPELVLPIFKIQEGEIYSEKKLKKGFEKLRDAYGAQGYFQYTGFTKRTPNADKKTVDLVLDINEDKQYFVGKINFAGNDSTRDKVIRREVYLTEGDVFNTELLKLSIRRINQLGYFKPIEGAPQLGQSELAEDKIDVTLKVEEQNRNQFTFGGGVSGLEGKFLNASFQTSNFLGQGETFQISAQTGKRTKNYQFAVTEPYLFDRPITAGIDIYKRKIIYQTYASANVFGYQDDRTGGSFTTGFPLGRFSRVFLNYAYEVVNISQAELDPNDPLNFSTPLISDSFFIEDFGKRRESRFSPSLVYNTVDNPFTPRSGMKLSASGQFTGGPLGGTLNYLRPDLEAIFYIPHTRKTSLGIRAQFGMIRPFSSTSVIDPVTGRSSLPFYLRFYMGGEQQIRGYNIRAVGPREPSSSSLVGGDKFALFNAEYYIDVAGPVRALLFFDAGQSYLQNEKITFRSAVISTGAELRFIMPVLNVPFRLIYAFNPNADPLFAEKRVFRFAVGTTF
ncbi:MAG: outer membrane protein assembly factor BamA [Vicinamibacteria bacterium]|jgi:outer membrane protein insertion porin family|nr:outer membrane protein assembly factor BamA [Vicinamibacteria bacterium]